jgi:hypothetical protein
MAHIDPILSATPVARIAGPHQSTVATILRAVELGLFTAAQAELMIDRVRAHLTALPPLGGRGHRRAGSRPAVVRICHTVDAATVKPRTRSSPWIRR